MKVLVDTDILIEVSRGRDAQIVARWREVSESRNVILYSVVTSAELWAGARPPEFSALEALLAALGCVAADESVGRRAGEFLRRYQRSHGVELGDAMIAASAADRGAVLWTRNRKHYPMPEIEFFD